MSNPDDAWESEKDDVFNVVADIDPPSVGIEYAFKAGYVAAELAAADAERRLETLLDRAYPFLTWQDAVRGVDPALDAEFDGIVRDVEIAIQHLPDDKEF